MHASWCLIFLCATAAYFALRLAGIGSAGEDASFTISWRPTSEAGAFRFHEAILWVSSPWGSPVLVLLGVDRALGTSIPARALEQQALERRSRLPSAEVSAQRMRCWKPESVAMQHARDVPARIPPTDRGVRWGCGDGRGAVRHYAQCPALATAATAEHSLGRPRCLAGECPCGCESGCGRACMGALGASVRAPVGRVPAVGEAFAALDGAVDDWGDAKVRCDGAIESRRARAKTMAPRSRRSGARLWDEWGCIDQVGSREAGPRSGVGSSIHSNVGAQGYVLDEDPWVRRWALRSISGSRREQVGFDQIGSRTPK